MCIFNGHSYANNQGPLYELSVQQIVDCATSKYGNDGCNGGLPNGAWNYLETHGQEKNSDYPYTAKDGTCKYDSAKGKVKTQSESAYSWAGPGDGKTSTTAEIMASVTITPNAVGIAASSLVFQTYKSGVITSSKCGHRMDHEVAVFGYDSTASEPYWLVRNSWGSSWGEDGYVRLGQTTGRGICGINQDVVYPNPVSAWE